MKNLKYLGGIGLMALALCLPSCDKEDNTDELLSGLNGLEKRVAALEALQGQVDAIQAILDAAANNYLITSVVENKEGEVVTGYTITFSNGETITIQNGKDGEAGITPEISVAEEGGNLYWKVNGQWLMNGENKVPAEGIAPQFKIEDNVWKVSYDGVNFVEVPGSPNPGGTEITYDDKGSYYEFNVGGTVCAIAKYQPLNITFTSGLEVASDAKSAVVEYKIADDAAGVSDYIIMAFANSDYTVTIDKATKKITVDGGVLPIAGQEITILVSDGGQRTIMRSFKFVGDGSGTTDTTVEVPYDSESNPLRVAATGGEQTITVSSDFAQDKIGASIPTEAATWISITDDSQIKSRAAQDYTLKLKVEANETEQLRSAVITITAGEGESAKTATFKIEQDAAVEESSSYTYAYNSDNANTLQAALESALGVDQLQAKTTLVITGTKPLTKDDLIYLRELSKKYALRNLNLSASATTTIVSEAFSYSNLESVILPETATRIYGSAFRDCASLTSIVIPASVKGISNTAFLRNVSLKTVVFKGKTDLVTENEVPSTRIFEGCSLLESITIEHAAELINPGSVEGTNSNNFADVPETCILYVPESILGTYQADANGWAKAFPDRIKKIGAE